MTHLRIEQNTSGTEQVSSNVILKIYDLVHDGNLDLLSDLKGRLHSTSTYLIYKTYLEGLFNGLNDKGPLYITADKYYLWVEDPEVRSILASTYGDGTGVSEAELANVSTIENTFVNNTNIVTFNEFKYFTGINFSNYRWSENWFYGCSNLREITIPKNVKNFVCNNGAFRGCTSLQTVTFDTGSLLEHISGFTGCSSLTNIILPSSVITIGGEAFRECSSLNSIDIGNVTTIEANAFKLCTSLTSIDLTNVESIGNECFYDSALTSITSLNSLQTIGNSGLSCGDLVINDLSIPNLTSLGDGAFYGSKIKQISNLGLITSLTTSAFRNCKQLTSVVLPLTAPHTGSRVFLDCSALTTVTNINNITRLGERIFNGCTSLGTGLTLELNLTNLDVYPHNALRGTKYTRLILHSPQLTGSHDGRYPLYEDMRDVTYIDLSDFLVGPSNDAPSYRSDSDFYNNNSLVTFIYPSNVNYIGVSLSKAKDISGYRYAIILATTPPGIKIDNSNNPPSTWFTSGNLHIYVPDSAKAAYLADADWSTIGGYNGSDTIIDRLHGLSELPNGVWTTGLAASKYHFFNDPEVTRVLTLAYAVEDNVALTNSDIAAITNIPANTFKNNTSLLDFSDLDTISNCTVINLLAFSGCSNLTNIDLSNITTIGANVFLGCSALTSVNLSNVTTIGNTAFKGCSSLTTIGDLSNCTSINWEAFQNCTSLTSIDLSSCTSISNNTFNGCTSLTTIVLSNCTYIGANAFRYCSSLSTIDLNNIQIIDANAFENCTSLTSINLTSCTDINGSSFKGCTGLTTVNNLSLTTIKFNNFDGCSSLATIDLSGVVTVLQRAFLNCSSLTSLDLSSCTSIGLLAFLGCTNVQTITLNNNLTALPLQTFNACRALTTINVDHIEDLSAGECFLNCTSLTTIDISSCTNLGNKTFSGCAALTTVKLGNNLVTVGLNVFLSCSALTTIQVPAAKLSDYQALLPGYASLMVTY